MLRIVLRVEQFTGTDACEFVGQFAGAQRRDGKSSGAEFCPREGSAIVVEKRHSSEWVFAALFEHGFVGERAWGDEAGDLATDNALGGRGVFHLLAYSHAMPCCDHPAEVAFDRMKRHARHRHACGALCERDAERFVGERRVVVEHFIEIAHAEEEHALRVLLFECAVLPHRRRVLLDRRRGGSSGVGRGAIGHGNQV